MGPLEGGLGDGDADHAPDDMGRAVAKSSGAEGQSDVILRLRGGDARHHGSR
jgi:hypothetical protein